MFYWLPYKDIKMIPNLDFVIIRKVGDLTIEYNRTYIGTPEIDMSNWTVHISVRGVPIIGKYCNFWNGESNLLRCFIYAHNSIKRHSSRNHNT